MKRTDFIDPERGVLATLEDHVPLAMFQREPEEDGASLELDVRPEQPQVILAGDYVGHWEVRSARLEGKLVTSGGEQAVSGFGAVTNGALEAGADPESASDPAVLRRLLTIGFEDGGLLALAAACGPDAESHADETVVAGECSVDGTVGEFSVPLLSTQYGHDGMQQRATLELWSPEGHAVRGGGTVLAGVELELPGARTSIAFFEWSVDGRPGIGRYEIIRAA